MNETFASRRRKLLDALQSDMTRDPPQTPWGTLQMQKQLNRDPQGNPVPFQRPAPVMTMGMGETMGMRNPALVMGGGMNSTPMLGDIQRAAPGFGQMPIPQNGSADMPAPMAANAGPAPMPPQRPAMFGGQQAPAVPMPPQRPEGLGSNDPMALIRGYNAQAFAGDPQAVANQFTEGDLARLAARTYRNEDGSIWNDYYVK